ncbi:MAG: hypothetical protein ACI4K8_00050 [Candidatus Fimenecus sp.]
MSRRRALYIGLSAVFLFLLVGCCQQEFVFPEKENFEIQLEVVSVSEYDKANYQVQVKTVFINNFNQDLQMYGGECLLDLLFNNKDVQPQKNSVLALYSLELFAKHTETKTIQIPKAQFVGSQLQAKSNFYLEGKNGSKQNYVIESEIYTLTEEDL